MDTPGTTPTPAPVVNKDYANASNAPVATPAPTATPGVVAPIASTPPVISSKDMASSFASSSAALSTKTTASPKTQVTLGNGQTVSVDSQGNFFDANGASIDPSTIGKDTAPTPSTTGTDTTSTAVEKGAAAGEGDGTLPNSSTGDPIYDSLQKWEQDQETKNEADAADKKAQVATMLQTNLANTNATYAATVAGIQSTYGQLIDTQTRINGMNVGRVKAYGLASGNAMSTPIEFTYAVSNEEQTAMNAIGDLDAKRDAALATAKSAMDDADAKLLSDSMASVDTIEKDMQTQAAALQSQVDARYQTLQKIEDEQKTQLAATQQNLIAAAITQYGTSYANETDPAKKDALIKQIVNASGAQLDYGSVFAALSANATTVAAAKSKAASDAADLALKGAQTAEATANAAKTQQGNVQSQAFNSIDDRLQKGVIIDGRSTAQGGDGGTYLDTNGYMTKDGFDTLVQAAHQKGISRSTFLKEYGGYLDPGGYSNYGLTKAEQDTLTDVNKTTPIVIPEITTSGG